MSVSRFMISETGKRRFIDHGHVFRFHKQSKRDDSVYFFVCDQPACFARLHIRDGKVYDRLGHHNHSPNSKHLWMEYDWNQELVDGVAATEYLDTSQFEAVVKSEARTDDDEFSATGGYYDSDFDDPPPRPKKLPPPPTRRSTRQKRPRLITPPPPEDEDEGVEVEGVDTTRYKVDTTRYKVTTRGGRAGPGGTTGIGEETETPTWEQKLKRRQMQLKIEALRLGNMKTRLELYVMCRDNGVPQYREIERQFEKHSAEPGAESHNGELVDGTID